jgi:hypothetical protein
MHQALLGFLTLVIDNTFMMKGFNAKTHAKAVIEAMEGAGFSVNYPPHLRNRNDGYSILPRRVSTGPFLGITVWDVSYNGVWLTTKPSFEAASEWCFNYRDKKLKEWKREEFNNRWHRCFM